MNYSQYILCLPTGILQIADSVEINTLRIGKQIQKKKKRTNNYLIYSVQCGVHIIISLLCDDDDDTFISIGSK